MPYSTIYFGIGIASSFGPKLPYCPVGIMLVVEELDESVGRVSVGALRKGRGWAGSCNDCRT